MKIQNAFLRGQRIYLRMPEKNDAPTFLRWMNDPEIRIFLAQCFPIGFIEEEEWIAALPKKKTTDVVFMIVTNSGTPIGCMGLHQINWVDRTATTGAVIGNTKYHGRGYGTEAKSLLLDYAFQTLDLFKINSRVIGFNTRSRRYNEKCGYILEGTLKEQIYRDGKRHDELIMSVSRDGWQKAKKRLYKQS